MTPIPRTLDEAVEQILGQMTEADKRAFAAEREQWAGSSLHFGGGMAMRNEWGLWHGLTPISAFLRSHRLFQGDDLSAVIYQAVWRRLHGCAIGDVWLAERAAYYAAFWERTAGLTWDQQPIPGWKASAHNTTWFKMTEGGLMEELPGQPGTETQEGNDHG